MFPGCTLEIILWLIPPVLSPSGLLTEPLLYSHDITVGMCLCQPLSRSIFYDMSVLLNNPEHQSHSCFQFRQCQRMPFCGFPTFSPGTLTWQHKSISPSFRSCLPNVVMSVAGSSLTVCEVSLAVTSGCIVFVMTALVSSRLAAAVDRCWSIDTRPATEFSLSRFSAAVKPSKSQTRWPGKRSRTKQTSSSFTTMCDGDQLLADSLT